MPVRIKINNKIAALVFVLLVSLLIIILYSMTGFAQIKTLIRDNYDIRMKLKEDGNELFQEMCDIDINLLTVSNMSLQNLISENLYDDSKIKVLADKQLERINLQKVRVDGMLELNFINASERELLMELSTKIGKYGDKVSYAIDFISSDINIFISYIQVSNDYFMEIKNKLTDFTNMETGFSEKNYGNSISKLDSIIAVFIIISIISFVLSLIIAFFIGNSITVPIKKIISMLKNISEGEGDLTKKLSVSTNDELMDMASYFNSFIEKLRGMILNIKNSGQKSGEVGSNLASVSEEVSANVVEVSASMNSCKDKIKILDNEIAGSNTAINDIKIKNNEIVNLIANQGRSISNSSLSINELAGALQHIMSLASEKKILTDNLVETAKDGSDKMENSLTSIDEISNSANVMLEMIDVINNVASQTNLLSMNAAIEAAHAGEYGKGFSVVAEEIRNLAEATSENSKNISTSLKGIIEKIHYSSDITRNAGISIQGMISDIYVLAASLNEILHDIKGISENSGKVISSFNDLVVLTEKIELALKEMVVNEDAIAKSMNAISMLSGENTVNFNEMNLGLNEIVNTSTFLSQLSQDNANNIKIIEDEIVKFRT